VTTAHALEALFGKSPGAKVGRIFRGNASIADVTGAIPDIDLF
jgi:hypothetical protein